MQRPLREFDHIAWIRERAAGALQPAVPLGIGDDAALLRLGDRDDCLVAVDMLMEGAHFTFPPATPYLAGRKALAVNLSDLAAMAGSPVAAFVAVALPRGRGEDFPRDLHRGIQELADEFGVAIAGGDTNSWDGPLVISVTVLGRPHPRGAITRAGAQAGDWIFVTGELGGSLSGRHLTFQPRVHVAQQLADKYALHAMIDISDGLAADLFHILDESRAGAILDGRQIPISSGVSPNDDRTRLEHALSDGEDFELLFTLSPEDGAALLADDSLSVPVTRIGEIVEQGRCELIDLDGAARPLVRSGWEHRL